MPLVMQEHTTGTGEAMSPSRSVVPTTAPYSIGIRVANPAVHVDQRHVPRPRMRGVTPGTYSRCTATPMFGFPSPQRRPCNFGICDRAIGSTHVLWVSWYLERGRCEL